MVIVRFWHWPLLLLASGCAVPVASDLGEGDANQAVVVLEKQGISANKERDPEGEGVGEARQGLLPHLDRGDHEVHQCMAPRARLHQPHRQQAQAETGEARSVHGGERRHAQRRRQLELRESGGKPWRQRPG